jgi:hypothetical protein
MKTNLIKSLLMSLVVTVCAFQLAIPGLGQTKPSVSKSKINQKQAVPTAKIPVSDNLEVKAVKGDMRALLKAPAANKSASLIFNYYGDSKYNTLGQETVKLKKAMEGYDFKVLLKHESLPSWMDLSEKDEKLANIKDLPTKANLFKYLKQLTEDGYFIDVYIFSHGSPGKFKASTGTFGSEDWVTTDDIQNRLSPEKTGFTKIPIRMTWGTYCYGSTLGEAWRSVGAKTTAGAKHVQFYPTAFNNFVTDWNKGNVTFDAAVGNADTATVRTVAQTYISVVHAPSHNREWGNCPVLKTVLGDHECAKEYFTEMWIGSDWVNGKSGKENMNQSSFMMRGGEKTITKNTRLSWQ